jgi:hypothetical protein
VASALLLAAEMDMHDRRARVGGPARLGGHLLGCDRDVVALRVGEHTGQRARDDGLGLRIGHGGSGD